MTWLVVYFMLEQERQRPETSLHTQCVRVGTWPFSAPLKWFLVSQLILPHKVIKIVGDNVLL